MKKKVSLFLFLFLIGFSFYDALSYPEGIAGRTGGLGEGSCATSCHNSLVGSVNGTPTGNAPCTVTAGLIGLNPGDKYQLGKTYQGYVTIIASGRYHWGLETMIVKNSGLFSGDNAGTIVPTNRITTQVMYANRGAYIRRYLTHTNAIGRSSSAVIASNQYTFNFTWVSPATPVGDVTFVWLGMATNSDGSKNSADWIGTGNYTYLPPF